MTAPVLSSTVHAAALHAKTPAKLCIGLPVYNGARYLEETLSCLTGQTLDDLQIVISDNASTDATESICRAFAQRDERIAYVRHEQNRGGIWNFNHVFTYCQSPYFSWHAHDDLRAPDYYARCVAALDERPEAAWCHSRSAAINSVGEPLPDTPYRAAWESEPEFLAQAQGRPHRFGRLSANPVERFRGVLLGRGYCLDLFGVIRSDVLRSTRGIPGFIHSGKELLLELATRGEYVELPEEMFYVRLHDEQSTALNSNRAQARWNGGAGAARGLKGYFRRLHGYVLAASRAPLGPRGKAACLAALAPYLFQVRKFPRILAEAVGLRN